MKQGDDIDDSEEFYQQLEEEELATLKKHKRGKRGSRGPKGNSKTEGLYKEALMDSIFGRFQDASRKLKLMITLSPDSPEPYHLLGTMHEENGELDKAAQYLFMSTYLSPPNLDKWLKVGDLSFERKMYSQAAYCFGRALKIASCDPKIMIRRAEAFQLAGQSKKAITTYKRLLEISQSPEYTKKYAKLRYRREEHSLCRQILTSVVDYMNDAHLVYMLCETYLQEQSYDQAAKLLEEHLSIREEQMQQNEQLPSEFIVILLICCVALNRQCYGFTAEVLLEETKNCYEIDYAELYSQAVNHLSKFNQTMAFTMTQFLIDKQQHQTISNYLFVTDYLCKQKNSKCLKIIDQALKHFPYSPEVLAQRDYIFNCFGVGQTLRESDAIFYSDQDQPLLLALNPSQKRGVNETTDAKTMERLVENVEESLRILTLSMEKGNLPGVKEQETVLDGLELFISLAPSARDEEGQQKQGLYFKKLSKRRAGQGESKSNVITENIEIVIKYFQSLVLYLQGLLSLKQWRKLIQVGEKLSKVHFFKNHSKMTEFTTLKVRIYEMCVLSCLAVNRFNTAMFFLRYLVTKHPEDSLYVLSMHLLMRICPKKTFLSSALSKRLDNPGGEHLAKLLAVEYMETGCFELAVSAILRSSQSGESLGPTPQLCLAACLIQIASSRNTYNKLDFTNRSAICLASYEGVVRDRFESLFNKGRWYAQVKLNHKAIDCFQNLLSSEADRQIKERAAYCLICIYRDCDQFEKADGLSKQYFPISEIEEIGCVKDLIVQQQQ